MDTSDILALVALLVACLSALYARRAWREAHRANDINAHDRKLEVYRAFDALRFAMLQKACSVTHEETGKFHFPSRDSEFYFDPDIHGKLRKYWEICFELAELNSKQRSRNPEGEERDVLHREQDGLLSKEAALADEIDSLLRRELSMAKG